MRGRRAPPGTRLSAQRLRRRLPRPAPGSPPPGPGCRGNKRPDQREFHATPRTLPRAVVYLQCGTAWGTQISACARRAEHAEHTHFLQPAASSGAQNREPARPTQACSRAPLKRAYQQLPEDMRSVCRQAANARPSCKSPAIM